MSDVTAPAVRAVWNAARVPGADDPYATVHFRVAYPAAPPRGGLDPVLGIIGPDPRRLPLRVVVIQPNFNCGPELYAWLARVLALAGFAAVTYTWVSLLPGDRPGLGTGVDLTAVTPQTLGTRSPHLLLPCLLDALARTPDLAGALDLDHVVIGGHSAGGSLALLAASRAWHPQVRGAFSYAGHTRAQLPQGFGEDAYLRLAADVPLLLLGGTADGVVTAVAEQQTGRTGDRHPMHETHRRSVPRGVDSWLALLDGANHYAFAEGYDGSSGRGYLETEGTMAAADARALIADLVVDFCRYCLHDDAVARARLDATQDGERQGLINPDATR